MHTRVFLSMQALHAQLDLARQDRELLQRSLESQQQGTHTTPGPAHHPPGALLTENRRLHAQIQDLEVQISG